jgi:hypothetical protein
MGTIENIEHEVWLSVKGYRIFFENDFYVGVIDLEGNENFFRKDEGRR